MKTKCLRCNIQLVKDYHLVFDETGKELELDRLLEKHFQINVEEDPKTTQALCEDCVNELIELYDLTERNQEKLQTLKTGDCDFVELKHEQDSDIDEVEVDFESEDAKEVIPEGSCDEFSALDDEVEDHINLENLQRSSELEGVNTQEYVRKVIKSELQEVICNQNTKCRLCHEELKSHTAVLMHIASNHESEDATYPCIMCNRSSEFPSIKDLAYHIVLKHYDLDGMSIYCVCPECEKRFSTFPEFNKHNCCKKSCGSRVQLECASCSKDFISNKRYRFHLQFHMEKHRPKACFICDIVFSDENDFYEHIMYAHEKNANLVCKKCDRVCTTKKSYDNHIELHNAVRSYQCEYCARSYLYKQMLMNHIKRQHTDKDGYQCKICKKSLANKHLLSRHVQLKHRQPIEGNLFSCSSCGLLKVSKKEANTHIGESQCVEGNVTVVCLKIAYACEYCELAYNSVDNLKKHRKTHKKRQFICYICTSEYSEYKKLKTHIITHKKAEPIHKIFPVNRHYVCDFDPCDQSYLTWPSLRAHKTRHTVDANFICEVCSQSFKNQTQLSTHLKAHDNNEVYPCQFCAKICSSQMSLAVHIARKHNNNCIECSICKSTYATDEALKEHMEMTHVAICCDICGKLTKNKRNLDIHIRMVHTKVKRYFCSLCSKGYYNKSDLKVHEKAAHSEANKFKCGHCDFASSYESSYQAHLLLHADEKPFKCPECSKEFTRKACFKLHLLRHSDNKPFACPIEDCGKSFVTRGVLNTHIRDNHSAKQMKGRKFGRSPKRGKSNLNQVESKDDPIKFVIIKMASNHIPLEVENEDSDLVLIDNSNTGQGIILECGEENSDLIVDLDTSEVSQEFMVNEF